MDGNQGQKWQQQVEAILKKEFGEDEFWEQQKKAFSLIDLAQKVEPPTGDGGKIISILLKAASKELRPLSASYAAFQLGMAHERLQNANRA